jgi:signal transduction histidine kinase
MPRFKSQFIRELYVAFATLMLVTLAIAWYFNESVKWSQSEFQRSALTNKVLQDYQELSNLTLSELIALSNRILLGDRNGLSEQGSSPAALREALSNVREGVAAEIDLGGSAYQGDGPELLDEIERQVEEFIRSSELIEQALKDGRFGDARSELDSLRNAGFTDTFISLVAAATSDQILQSQRMGWGAKVLTRDITAFLPILAAAVVITTLFIITFFSRRLARSVSTLHQGVQAFGDGNLFQRIPDLSETEFQRLGEAFNTMATQLSNHRKELRDANMRLEETVVERTRELQVSNTKLAQVDAKRRKLLADISHEFRTPLTGIRGEAEIALRGSDKTDLDYQDSFRRIMEQADNATRLVDDLLFIARADAGEPRLKLSLVAVAGMIDAVCEEFSLKAEQRGISIGKGRADAKAYVMGDPGRLRQVLVILMDNALRYSNPGGRVEVQVLRMNENVEITVTDTGIGVSDEHSELVFERFYRAPNAEAQAPGTGLGLPVAKAIVEAHKGTISLKGKPGEGATAIVTLPVGKQLGIGE